MTAEALRVLVVDDEPLARRGLVRLLARHPGFVLLGECRNGLEAVRVLRAEPVDVVLLDVEMPELSGFDVLAALRPMPLPPVVFVTAFDTYAVQAFEAHALDYVLKPVEPERFADVLQRVEQAARVARAGNRLDALLDELDSRSTGPTRLAATSRGRTLLVPVDEIDWIQAADNYVRLRVDGRSVLHRETLAHVLGRLQRRDFVRIHRSHAVNVAHVRELRPRAHGDAQLVLRDGLELPVSRRYRAELERALSV